MELSRVGSSAVLSSNLAFRESVCGGFLGIRDELVAMGPSPPDAENVGQHRDRGKEIWKKRYRNEPSRRRKRSDLPEPFNL